MGWVPRKAKVFQRVEEMRRLGLEPWGDGHR
jgi:hypothetical protein